MSPLTVFLRTLARSSAIFLGIAIAVVHPSIDGGPRRSATAQQSPSEAAIDGLLVALDDSDPGVRGYSADALGRLHARRAVPALMDALQDAQAGVRLQAARALGRIGDARAATALAAALRDSDEYVRSEAQSAISALGG